jgi:nitrogenase molybdenum-iron protein alpha/beta subunit
MSSASVVEAATGRRSSQLVQPVAASTTEAEDMVAAYAVKEVLWLRTLYTELGMEVGSSPVL